jgi:microcystin degradation protein MlrC
VHVVATAHDDADLARAAAREVASWIWEHREDFRPASNTPEEAVRLALAEPGRPVVINETSDNPGGGTPGDGTHLLRAMLEAELDEACFSFISDPHVVQTAIGAGVGAAISVELGGKHDDLHGKPIALDAYVKAITDGRFVLQQMGAGMRVDFGPMARLVSEGIDILVASKPSQTFDPEVFLLHGIDVSRYKIVGLKSSQHFRAGFRDVAAAIVTADPPGLTTQRVEIFERRYAPGPLWPKDPDAAYAG